MWIAWHLGGMGWAEYLALPCTVRNTLCEALNDRIIDDNEHAEEAARKASQGAR